MGPKMPQFKRFHRNVLRDIYFTIAFLAQTHDAFPFVVRVYTAGTSARRPKRQRCQFLNVNKKPVKINEGYSQTTNLFRQGIFHLNLYQAYMKEN